MVQNCVILFWAERKRSIGTTSVIEDSLEPRHRGQPLSSEYSCQALLQGSRLPESPTQSVSKLDQRAAVLGL